MDIDLQYSRRDRIAYYLTKAKGVGWEEAFSAYDVLDTLPDVALIKLDEAIYDDLAYEGIIEDLR